MIIRNEYLNELIKWKHENLIKVVSGIRRCGKSTLFKMFTEHLKSEGVSDEQIIFINFEDIDNEYLQDYKNLYDYVKQRLCKDKWTYLLFDEIQNVNEFQKVVDSLYIKENVDIYLTGSNAYMLSGELATMLSGRYVEISMLPFSFKEYMQISNLSKEESFDRYLKFGSFPYSISLNSSEDKVMQYLEGIYNTIIVKDIEERQNRKNVKKIVDVVLLKTISKYLADIIGNPVSIKGISDYLTSNGRKVSDHTVGDYVETLTEAFLFYEVDRYDVGGKALLKTNKKYYIVDTGLRNYLLAKNRLDLGFVIENVVYLELKRRGYKINVGKLGEKEIDFVAQKKGVLEYYQVSLNMSDETTFEREMAPLKQIKDNYRKIILTLDRFSVGNYLGIEVVNLIDWLLQ